MNTPTADPAARLTVRRLSEGGWYWAADYRYAARRHVRSLAERVPPSYAEGRLAPVVLVAGVMEPWTLLRPIADRLNGTGAPR